MALVRYFPLNQAAAGTTVIAAAAAGNKHKVVGFFLAGNSGGGSTVKFTDGVADLCGPVFLDKVPISWPSSGPPFCETEVNRALNLVTTSKPFQGVVIYVTEP